MIDPSSAGDLIRRLGTMLADLTADRPPERIHAEILERLRSASEPDPQLAGIYLDTKDFESVWRAIRTGSALPLSSWDTVVLPVIAFFSAKQAHKANLESAIHLWRSARIALSNVVDLVPQPDHVVPGFDRHAHVTLDTLALAPAAPLIRDPDPLPALARSGRRFRVATASSIVLVVVVAAIVLANMAGPDNRPDPPALPSSPSTGATTVPPSAAPTEPAITPSATDPAAPAPAPPTGVKVVSKTDDTVTLSWQPPANTSPVPTAYYRVFYGMVMTGQIAAAAHTVNGLSPKTAYTFVVRGYSASGVASVPSNPVTTTTRPSLSLSVTPTPPVPLNTDFRINGADWPCTTTTTTTTAEIEILLQNKVVARTYTDVNGNFSAHLVPLVEPGEPPRLEDIDDPETLIELAGTMPFKVRLAPQPQCRPVSQQTVMVTFA